MKLIVVQFSPPVCHFMSAPSSQMLSVYVPPLISEIKFCTHTELQAKFEYHYQNLISEFPSESDFDYLLSFTST
jgi:hypothetical protein